MYGTTIGRPVGSVLQDNTPKIKNVTRDDNKIRCLNYVADYGGCGHWRMMWPSQLLNANQKAIVHNSSIMIESPNYYKGLKTVRMQRQVATHQYKFFTFLKEQRDIHDVNLIYEIDDVFIYDDIPKYNKFRAAFSDPKIKELGLRMMNECGEVTVTSNYMRAYYMQYCNNVTVIPNYMPKSWIDRFYDEDVLSRNYDKNIKKRKRPRVLYSASGAHFDLANYDKQRDDFHHVNDIIRKTSKDIQWVFIGAYPLTLKDLITDGKIEFHNWSMLPQYPRSIYDLKVNLTIAPLRDNVFNRCKSDLKLIESGAFGYPAICQDLVTYKNAPLRFSTGDELIDNINSVIKDKQTYMKHCRKARAIAESRWLDDHIEKYYELYSYSRNDPRRVNLNKIQGDDSL
jgi:hypothetical protein